MKTGAYWFKFLTDKEQEEFKVNCGKYFNRILKHDFNKFSDFIYSSFMWDKTKQGGDYWSKISQRKTD